MIFTGFCTFLLLMTETSIIEGKNLPNKGENSPLILASIANFAKSAPEYQFCRGSLDLYPINKTFW